MEIVNVMFHLTQWGFLGIPLINYFDLGGLFAIRATQNDFKFENVRYRKLEYCVNHVYSKQKTVLRISNEPRSIMH